MRGVVITGVGVISIAAAAVVAGCSRERIVKIGWDQPAATPDGYRIFIDNNLVKEIAPPPFDGACRCLQVAVPVPRGTHTIQVVAYSLTNGASPAASLIVR
jgi:hypothetical protein